MVMEIQMAFIFEPREYLLDCIQRATRTEFEE
jgi:hypothetical protein